jgi:perosamine synthetase
MTPVSLNRRHFLAATALAGAGLTLGHAGAAPPSKPALLGGPAAHPGDWPAWPQYDGLEDRRLADVLHSSKWCRVGGGTQVEAFEKAFCARSGARHSVATASGTAALLAALGALDIGPGDEVILPVYTFVATYNVVVLNHALPILVDVDPETFQIDAEQIEAAISPRTAAIIPVHMGGNVANLDRILAVARKHNVPVIEDCCQAHVASWRGKMVGNWGTAGCFSFQASKNLNSGEGGVVITNDPDIAAKCLGFHNQGRVPGSAGYNFSYAGYRGSNLRLTEFQGALLQAQMTRLEEQSRRREKNAAYLTRLLEAIPGLKPARMYDGCTRNNYHLYMFRYDKEQFGGLDRARFFAALKKEGIAAYGGYSPLHTDPYVHALRNNKHYQRLYPQEALDRWEAHTHCPQNDRLCAEGVWLTQNYLLGDKPDMEAIAEAITKIQKNAGAVDKAAAAG